MASGFEYLVCVSQCMKVTFVNGEYQGRVRGQQAYFAGLRDQMERRMPLL